MSASLYHRKSSVPWGKRQMTVLRLVEERPAAGGPEIAAAMRDMGYADYTAAKVLAALKNLRDHGVDAPYLLRRAP